VICATPTLVALPSNLLVQTLDQVSRLFLDLQLWSFYQDKDNINENDHPRRYAATVTYDTYDNSSLLHIFLFVF
jgi:hypothetical protein